MYKLAYGPMSLEIIKAIYQYSHINLTPLMIIASKNQIDYDYGYVCNTKQSKQIFENMKKEYPRANILICRDHCGPGFKYNHNTLEQVKQTIKEDIECGYQLIHIDLCHIMGSIEDKIVETCKLIKYAQSINNNIRFEIGTDENDGKIVFNLGQIKDNLDRITGICTPMFYVVQTGSLVIENKNTGIFCSQELKQTSQLLNDYNVGIKEHNADYLNESQIKDRQGIISALNIAPQLGVIQTCHIINQCNIFGVDYQQFLYTVITSDKWMKWTSKKDNHLKLILSGHYHFNSKEYLILINQLSKYINVEESIINEITKNIDYYRKNFYENSK